MSNRLTIVAVIAAAVLFLVYSSIFVVNERQQATARRMLAEGLPLREVAREMNVHHSTIARLA